MNDSLAMYERGFVWSAVSILGSSMGLDSVEIIMDIEDRFGIEITDAEAAQ